MSVNYFAVVLAHQCDLLIPAARRAAMAADLASLQNLDRLSPKYGGGMYFDSLCARLLCLPLWMLAPSMEARGPESCPLC